MKKFANFCDSCGAFALSMSVVFAMLEATGSDWINGYGGAIGFAIAGGFWLAVGICAGLAAKD